MAGKSGPKRERKADATDLFGRASNSLFARHKATGVRITARRFYDLPGESSYERQGYVLMTTRARRRDEEPKLF